MDGLLRATMLLGRVVHHCDKLKQKEQFKVRIRLLFRVGVREFEICGRGFKVRFDPKFNIDIPLLQNSLSTLLLVVPSWNLAITPSKCLASNPCWKHSEIWLCSWDRWDDTLVLRNGGNHLVCHVGMRGMAQRLSRKHAWCQVTFWQGVYQAVWVPWVCTYSTLCAFGYWLLGRLSTPAAFEQHIPLIILLTDALHWLWWWCTAQPCSTLHITASLCVTKCYYVTMCDFVLACHHACVFVIKWGGSSG